MRRVIVALFIIALFVVASIGALASPASVAAAPKLSCTIDAFEYDDLISSEVTNSPGPGFRIEHFAMGHSVLRCAGMAALSVDVWEHAYYIVNPATGHLQGRIELRLDSGDHSTASEVFRGRIDGTAECSAGLCTLDADVRASSDRGIKLACEPVDGIVDAADYLVWRSLGCMVRR